MSKPTNRLRLADSDDPTTPADIELARIAQSHREWCGPNGLGWKPYVGPTGKSANDVDEIVARQYRVVADRPVPWVRRALRRIVRWIR